MFSTGNSLFQQSNTTNSQNSQQQQQSTPNSGFQFGQGTPSAGTTTGNSGMFKYGASTATPGTSSFNFGGGLNVPSQSQSTATTNPNTFQSTPLMNSSSSVPVTSIANHPFQYIQQCFDPNHINYRFRAFFYNVADDLNEVQRRERQTHKPINISDALWIQVQNDNPDHSRMIPVLANGFGDLHARSRWEDEVIKGHTDKLNELNEKSSKLLRELDIDLIAKLRAAQQCHQNLSLRLLKIMKGIEVLRRSGSKLSVTESEALTKLKSSLSKISTGSLESGSLHNLNFQLESLLESGRLDAFRSARAIKPANEESTSVLYSLLQDQQEVLKKTVDSIQKDSSDLQIIKSGYQPL